MFRLSRDNEDKTPLDLLIALVSYLSTDAKTRRASLPPTLSSWRESGRWPAPLYFFDAAGVKSLRMRPSVVNRGAEWRGEGNHKRKD